MTSPGPQLRRRRLGIMHIVFFTVAAVGATDCPRRWRDGDVRRHRRDRRAAVVPHPGGRAGPVRGRLRRDEPVRRQRGRLLLVPGPRARRRRRPSAARSSRSSPTTPSRSASTACSAPRSATWSVRRPGLSLPWWVWAAAALLVVGLLGRAPRRPQRARARRAAGAGVHRGRALRHRRVRPPRRERLAVGAAFSPSSLFVPGVGGGLRVRRRRVHRLRVRRDLQRGVPQPTGHGGQGHVHRRRVHRAVLRRVVMGHDRHGRARGPAEAGRRERARRRVRRVWPRTGATASPRSPTCCSSPASSPRC